MEVRCLARTLHYSWPTCTWHKIIELILLWRCLGRGGLLWNINSWGASCSVAPVSSPLLRKSCTWSVSDDVMFPSLFWWGDHSSCNHLVLSQDFAITRTWYSVLRDTTKPAYHSKNPWQQVVLSWPNASLSSTAWCCNFLSSIAQEHLPWSIFHAALSLFFSVNQPRYIWAIDLLSLATLIVSHRQMCPCLRYMFSMVRLVGCECMVSLVHKAWFDDEFFV